MKQRARRHQPHMNTAAILLAALVTACGRTDETGESAVYIVPAGPDSAAVEYPIKTPNVEVAGEEYRLEYYLPELLVGKHVRVSFRGTLDASGRIATLTSELGSATCDRMPSNGALLRCDETLSNLSMDLAGVERAARAQAPSRVDELVATANRFASEPIGVLEVR